MKNKMHHYSADTNDRRKVNVYLALMGILCSYSLYWFCKYIKFEIPWWLDAPATFGFYSGFYCLFKIRYWENTILRKIFFIKTPNWNGYYECVLKTSYDNFQNEKILNFKIVQDWDTISVVAETDHSQSSSVSGCFLIKDCVSPTLTYEYLNQPKHDAPGSLHIHRGIASLSIEKNILKGEFYTGRDRVTYGKFESKKSVQF
jgi:hypothetical protein